MNALIYVNNGTVRKLSLPSGSWTTVRSGLTMGGLHILADYNPVHKVVAFGGGNGSRDLYKLDAQGNVTTLNPAPIVYNTHGSLMTTDPVSGDILFISNDSVYAYDIPSMALLYSSATELFLCLFTSMQK